MSFARPFAVALLIITLGISACGESLTAEQLIERSRASLAADELNAAAIDAKAALQSDPRSAEGRRLLGDIAMARADFTDAVSEYEKALSLKERDPEITADYAIALVEAGAFRKLLDESMDGRFSGLESNAIILAALANAEGAVGSRQSATEFMERALASTADDPFVRLIEVRHLARIGDDFDTVRQRAEKLVEDYPEYASGQSALAVVAGLQGDNEASIAAYDRALALNKRRLSDRLGLLAALLSVNDRDRATAEADSLEKLIPNSPMLNYYQGRLALAEGRIQDGLAELDAVLSVAPDYPGALYYGALANLESGNIATAERQLKAFLASNRSHLEARLALGSLYLRESEAGQAKDMANGILRDYAGNVPALRMLAAALTLQGAHAASADVYAQVLDAEVQPTANTELQMGTSLIRAGDEAGIASLERARDLDPGNEQARRLLVASYLAKGDPDKAMAEAEAFKSASPDAAAPYLLLATVALWQGDETGAAQALDEALERDPLSAEGLRGKAGLALRAGSTERAAAVYEEALKEQPGELSSLLALSVIYGRAEDYEAMAETLEVAIETNPTALPPRLILARHLLRTGEAAEGVRILVDVRDDYEDSAELHEALVGGFLLLGETGSALGAAQQLSALRPDNAAALRILAVTEQAEEQFDLAEQHIRRSLELEPESAQSRKTLVELFILRQKYDDLAEYLADLPENVKASRDVKIARGRVELLRGSPESAMDFLEDAHATAADASSTFFLVTAYFDAGQYRDGEALARDWLGAHPDDIATLNLYSTYLLTNGRDSDSIPYLEAINRLQPDNIAVMNNLAWVYRETNSERALELADKALTAAPGNMAILDTKAAVLKELGRLDQALKANDEALRAAPGFPQLLFHRGEILMEMGRNDEAVQVLEKVRNADFAEKAAANALLDKLKSRS